VQRAAASSQGESTEPDARPAVPLRRFRYGREGRRVKSLGLLGPDDENGVGLFEPVATRAEFRRRGLGAAVCTFGLRRLHEEGMRRAVVCCDTEPACALCESLGFRRS
jgi:ribosomal protein S18 acetylase RimI-like enzyme